MGSGGAVVVIDTSLEAVSGRITMPAGRWSRRDAVFFEQAGDRRVLLAADLTDFSLSKETALDW